MFKSRKGLLILAAIAGGAVILYFVIDQRGKIKDVRKEFSSAELDQLDHRLEHDDPADDVDMATFLGGLT